MVSSLYPSPRTVLLLPQVFVRDGVVVLQRETHNLSSESFHSPPPSPSPSSRNSPAILSIVVIVAVIFFISGILHLLVRFLIRKNHLSSNSGGQQTGEATDALQRQLQQLFHLHDAGLDQASIDALPVFMYREIVGSKEPFDCAVCLCEFMAEDSLRLLPVCGHAFHLSCIDTWLLANSTCPLCRSSLFVPDLALENPMFVSEDSREEEEEPSDDPCEGFSKPAELEEAVAQRRVFPVRLGKFRNVGNQSSDGGGDVGDADATSNAGKEVGESSGSDLDARRCYSMGSYQYVVADASLQVELSSGSKRRGDVKGVRSRGLGEESKEGKRMGIGSKGESLSVSKIWQWSDKKGRLTISADAPHLDGGLPWMTGRRRRIGDV